MHNKRAKQRMLEVFIQDPWGIRGPGAYTYSLCNALAKHGLDVHLITNQYYEYDELSNFEVTKVFFKHSEKMKEGKIRKIIRGFEYVTTMMRLLYIYLNSKPDIIHIQWLLLYQFDFFWLRILKFMLRKSKTKLVLTAHNVLPHVNGYKHKSILMKIYPQFDAIIVHGEALKSQMHNILGASTKNITIEVIPHGSQTISFRKINMERVAEYEKSIQIRRNNKGRRFLFIGVIHKNKGLDILLKAWEKHLLRYPNDTLYIVGKPVYNIKNELQIIKNKFNKTVLISMGFKSDEEIMAYYLSTDFVVLPYKEASQSGVLLSALTLGKPVIVTNVGELPSTVNAVSGGYIVPPNDFVSLCEALDKASKVPFVVLSKWSKNIQKKTYEKFSWDSVAVSTIKLYNRLLFNAIGERLE